jgi:hypothetical protein
MLPNQHSNPRIFMYTYFLEYREFLMKRLGLDGWYVAEAKAGKIPKEK